MRARTLIVMAAGLALLGLGACAHANDGDFGGGGAGAASSASGDSASTSGSGSTTTASTSGSTTGSSVGSTSATASSSGSSGSASASASTGASMTGTTPYFSEYVEGTSNNKALEIFNPGASSIDLGDCEIARYQNGSSSPLALPLDPVTLGAGQVFVVCNTGFDDTQVALCDQLSGNVQHTGNDVVELVCGGVVLDVIGRVGEDAVWGAPPTTTMDATLRRKCTVTVGDKNPSDAFDPQVQWSGFAVDSFDDLGVYACP